ncbi:MAG: flippase-like domain-containing protein [bacterium]|nr:flippase-like domain-containing protein [bacterium]
MTSSDDPSDQPTTPSDRARRWSTISGTLIGLAGVAFIVQTFVEDREQVADAVAEAQPALLAVAFLLGLLGMTGIGLAWRTSLAVLGFKLDVLNSLRGYFVGQLGKYVPGGIWAIMGRGEWARSRGVPAAIAYSSVFLSMGSAYLAAVLLAATLVPLSGLLGADGDTRFALVLLLLPLGFGLLHPRVVRAGLDLLRRVTGRDLAITIPSWRSSSAVVLQQLPSWLLIGLVSVTVASAFGGGGDAVNLISATAISWVVGFLVLPVPGGIGVRESVFVALATSLPGGIAATVAVVARLIFIAVDASGAGVTTILMGRKAGTERSTP